ELINKVIVVDQRPLGNTPASNPATYTGVFDDIRELFTRLPDAKVRGYRPARFSFNRPGGRCEDCDGNGQRCIEMHFLPDVWVECESCHGTRYVSETLDVRYHGRNIAEVLRMRVSEALELFANVPKVKRMLQTLYDVGLGYVELGQPAPTLSGGEAQRVKLAAELGRPSTGKTLYILDEPTTGLHFDDLAKLLTVLHRLVDLGNTCICIEHNLDVIKTADWVIDLGPEAGEDGGRIVAEGTPEAVAKTPGSHTGEALRPVLEAGPVAERHCYTQKAARDQEKVLTAPLKLGEEVAMPWERDGRSWHTVDHLDSQGRPVAWDTQLLIWFVETIESLGTFAPTDWENRTRVEITAGKNKQWFAHFLTGGGDLLDISFRVPEGTFNTRALGARLKIKTLDERTDLPIYGQWNRTRVRPVTKGWAAVRLTLRDFKDVAKRPFRAFLKEAVAAYFERLKTVEADSTVGKPWKTDGRQWHLSQQGMGTRHVAQWTPTLLMAMVGRFKALERHLQVSWNHQTAVQLSLPGETHVAGKIVTNIGRGLRIELRAPRGLFTPAQIDRLGEDPEIKQRGQSDYIIFWTRSLARIDTKQLADVWRRCRTASADGRLQSA
ncbi:MAG: excinuclease ABC subunit A, partial [Planctomycetes bacterium]|nr:excinuclease ABC subunit A [Planctomycetota bacterium]